MALVPALVTIGRLIRFERRAVADHSDVAFLIRPENDVAAVADILHAFLIGTAASRLVVRIAIRTKISEFLRPVVIPDALDMVKN